MGTGELSGKPDEMLWDYLRWTSIPSHGNRDKLRLCGPLGSCAAMMITKGTSGSTLINPTLKTHF